MQRGLATIEIILATIIIAVLVKVAVPNAARIIDRVSLDYEIKHFYSDLRYIQSMGRSSKISDKGMGQTGIINETGVDVNLIITPEKNGYQIFRGKDNNKKALREPHYFSNGVKINLKDHEVTNSIKIEFDEEGKAKIKCDNSILNSATLVFTSNLKKKKFIKFDSVGRIRADLTE
ncbi:MAG: hypothetical protein IKT98_05390 [Selenomonadaceae bacterium]|nr:hypothetical protein [Selenomonadaceae bacterium]